MKPIHYLLFMPAVLLLMFFFYLHFHKQLINRNDKIIYGLFIIPIMIICCQFPVVLVFLFYAAISFLVFDLFRKLQFILADTLYMKGFMPFMIAFALVVWGSFNYSDLVMTSYDIKVSGLKNDYTIMMISDLHLGKGASVERLQDIIDRVNKNNIDLFIMAGDIFDDESGAQHLANGEAYPLFSVGDCRSVSPFPSDQLGISQTESTYPASERYKDKACVYPGI